MSGSEARTALASESVTSVSSEASRDRLRDATCILASSRWSRYEKIGLRNDTRATAPSLSPIRAIWVRHFRTRSRARSRKSLKRRMSAGLAERVWGWDAQVRHTLSSVGRGQDPSAAESTESRAWWARMAIANSTGGKSNREPNVSKSERERTASRSGSWPATETSIRADSIFRIRFPSASVIRIA